MDYSRIFLYPMVTVRPESALSVTLQYNTNRLVKQAKIFGFIRSWLSGK